MPATLGDIKSPTRRTGGRPSHNYVQAFRLRLGLDAACAVLAATSDQRKPYQPYLAALVEVGLRHRDELPDMTPPDEAAAQTLDGSPVGPLAPQPSTQAGAEAFRDFKLRLAAGPSAQVNAATSDRGRPYQPYLAALVEAGLRHRDELPSEFLTEALLSVQEVLLDKTG